MNLREFLSEKCKNVENPLSLKHIAFEFKEKTGEPWAWTTVVERIRKYRQTIHHENIDENEKIRRMFGLGTKLDSNLLEKIQKNGSVDLDEQGRIIRYESNDGRMKLRGEHSHSSKMKLGWCERKRKSNLEENGQDLGKKEKELIPRYSESDSDEEMDSEEKKEEESIKPLLETQKRTDIRIFLTQKCENIDRKLCIDHLAKEYTDRIGSTCSHHSVVGRIVRYRKTIHNQNIDEIQKIRQIFGLRASVDTDFLKEIRKNATVDVDAKGRIIRYESNDGRIKLRGDHSKSEKALMKETEKRMKIARDLEELFKDFEEEREKFEEGIDDFDHILSNHVKLEPFEVMDEGNDHVEGIPVEDFVIPKQEPATEWIPKMVPHENLNSMAILTQKDRKETMEEVQIVPQPIQQTSDFKMFNFGVILPRKTEVLQRKILKYVHRMILTLNSKSLLNLQSKIRKLQSESDEKTIGMGTIQLAIDTFLHFIKTSSVIKSSEESISFIGLLYLIKQFVIALEFDDSIGVLNKINEDIKELDGIDKKVPIGKVEYAFSTALNIIIS